MLNASSTVRACRHATRWRPPTVGTGAQRRGATLLELLVAVSVIGLLMAVLIPAVQRSRSSSRRLQCAARLRDVGLALANYESAHRVYPDSYTWRVELLSYLEQGPLKEQFDQLEEWSHGSPDAAPAEWHLQSPVAQYICPAETNERGTTLVNYYANMGSGLQAFGFNGFISPAVGQPFYYGANGIRHETGRTKPGDIRDGLSNTVAFSEALAGKLSSHRVSAATASREDLLRIFWKDSAGFGGSLIEPDELRERAARCRTVAAWDAPAASRDRGMDTWPRWRDGSRSLGAIIHGWAYDHVLTPNSPSCGNSYWGIFSATSRHADGVNVVFGDAHSRFIAESIDGELWAALGTRSGAETLTFE